jgi:hypothetical protein
MNKVQAGKNQGMAGKLPAVPGAGLETAERLLVLDRKLSAILKEEGAPTHPDEAAALASLCQQSDQKRYAASACLYADVFTAEPKLTADQDQQRRPGCRARRGCALAAR